VTTSFGAYELLAPLAKGGTAEVFLARRPGLEGFVVVKQLLPHFVEDPDFIKMFLDEARLGAQLRHPNIAQTLELGQEGGKYFLAMEYVAGLTLGQLTSKARARVRGGLPVELGVALLEQACIGLHHAHEARLPDGTELKIVHRDVSPQNLVVTFQGQMKILDFGIAHAAVREARTKTGMIKGKFAYMSPEQCLGKAVDRRTDVFAAGVVLWETITGKRLFKRKSSYETYQAIVRGEVTPPSQAGPGVDAALDAIVMRALAYAADGRHPTAAALAEDLRGWMRARGAPLPDAAAFFAQHFAAEMQEQQAWLARATSGKPAPQPVAELWSEEEPASDQDARPTRDLRVATPSPATTVERRATPAAAPIAAAGALEPHEVTTFAAAPEDKTALAPVPLPDVPEASPMLRVGAPAARPRDAGWLALAILAVVIVVAAIIAAVAR
jgi:eukaryotic-like serine/threonine-protein kinase